MTLRTDYLIIGAGAVGMTFADQLLSETDATITLVDRRPMPGGHWNDAYPFVRLHQPSAFYGVGSRELGTGRIDQVGFNAGNHELASGAEVLSYFDALMRERFLPSGRVTWLPMSDHLGEGRVVSRLSGAVQNIAVGRKIVDGTAFDTKLPSTHPPAYQVDTLVRLVTPNTLPREAASAVAAGGRYVIVGGGKTAMDVGVWLLGAGARPEAIRWIAPRAAWLINRDTVQPGQAFFRRTAGGQALQLEAMAEATSLDDLFERLERAGLVLRVDPRVRPTMYRGATASPGEVETLRRIPDVVRLGHVRRIGLRRIELDDGEIEAAPQDLYIDCTARGIGAPPPVPVFDGDKITVQMLRANVISFSAAIIAHVEALGGDEAAKNALCAPIPTTPRVADWPALMLADMRNARAWSGDKPLRRWMSEHRLSGFGGAPPSVSDPLDLAIAARIREARPRAEANLERLVETMAERRLEAAP
jgi:hypothetical protein